MATDSAVEEIKSRLDIVELVADYVQLKRSGQNHKGLCPFHAEKTPSFMVNRAKQIFHCFGCGAGGDVFGFVMRHDGLTFPEALELLAKRAGVELKPHSGPRERGLKDAIKAVNREAQDFFVKSLAATGQAMEYLRKRGISEEAQRAFGLGYAPDNWHALSEHLKRKGFKEPLILKAGLSATGQKGPYDIFRGRLMFPITDMHGDTVAFGGRIIGEGQPKYLNSPDTPVFKKSRTLYALYQAKNAVREADEAIVAEGYTDVIMCHQHGVENVVAPLGTALTTEHVRILGRYASRLVLVFDGDQAGVAAARRSLDIILSEGLPARALLLPEGQDPDSVLKDEGPERFKEMLSGALSPVEFVLKTSGADRTGAVREALGVIASVKEPLRRDELLRELSERTGTRELTLREQMARLGKKAGPKGERAEGRAARRFAYNEEVLLLSAAVSVPEKAGDILERLSTEELRDGLVRGVFEKLKGSGANAVSAAEGLSEAESALVSRLSLEPGFDFEEADRVVDDCIRKIERRRVDEKIEEARSSGDLARLSRLLSERQKLMQEAG